MQRMIFYLNLLRYHVTRPTYLEIDSHALQHNVQRVKACCNGQKLIAMVKANAYGCGLTSVVPILENEVHALGVACLEEATVVRRLTQAPCILFQGIFSAEELHQVLALNLQCVIHHPLQLNWLLNTPLLKPLRVWVKVNTGMQRLGFEPSEVYDVLTALNDCQWVEKEIGLISHMASADEPQNPQNQTQLDAFNSLQVPTHLTLTRSSANSAMILSRPADLFDAVRPGIMLYGVSPFADKKGIDLGLKPVMRFISALSVIHTYAPNKPIGYGGVWKSDQPTRIGVVAAGYGDGYPRHIAENTPIWINGHRAPIVGHVSMDMLSVDLTKIPMASIGDRVELWGEHISVEEVAKKAGTIAYELVCQVSSRVRENTHLISC